MVDATLCLIAIAATLLAIIFGYFYLRPSLECKLSSSVDETKALDSANEKPDDSSETVSDDEAETPQKSKDERWSIENLNSDTGDMPIDRNKRNLANESIREDPVDYCEHIQREMKKTKHRVAMEKIEADMTEEQKAEERSIQRRQLEEIFRLMQNNKDEFGMSSVDEIQEQVKLYM